MDNFSKVNVYNLIYEEKIFIIFIGIDRDNFLLIFIKEIKKKVIKSKRI